MFKIGDYVVYGTNGVCHITDICASPFDKRDGRTFYVLRPVSGSAASLIYTPVDNERVPMRRLMTAQQIHDLILAMPTIALLQVPMEKQRREIYRATVNALEPSGYVSVMKTVQRRQEELTAAHKHFPVSDMEYGRLAKHLLYSECAHVLGIEEDGVEAYIAQHFAVAE